MAKHNDITIIIEGKTHHFNQGDTESFKSLPWSERKQLIELLEGIKQAEYIKQPAGPQVDDTREKESVSRTINGSAVQAGLDPNPINHQQAGNPADAGFDASVKKSDKDVDDLMQRLIIQEKQHHKPIPDKSTVMKLLVGMFVVIFVLAVMF